VCEMQHCIDAFLLQPALPPHLPSSTSRFQRSMKALLGHSDTVQQQSPRAIIIMAFLAAAIAFDEHEGS
jgi:hypothetical protein